MVEISRTAGPDWPEAWASAREKLRRELGDGIYEAWIRPLTLESCDNDALRIGTTLSFMRDRVAERYAGRIERALQAAGAHPSSVSIVLSFVSASSRRNTALFGSSLCRLVRSSRSRRDPVGGRLHSSTI